MILDFLLKDVLPLIASGWFIWYLVRSAERAAQIENAKGIPHERNDIDIQ